MSDAVNHPAHYGGEDDLYEEIKISEATLTPQEFVGAMKFNISKYNRRAPGKAGLQDHEKASWYQNRLVAYIKRVGFDTIYPASKPVYWGFDGFLYSDPHSVISVMPCKEVFCVNCNVAPFTRFFVKEETDTGQSLIYFKSYIDACAFLNKITG